MSDAAHGRLILVLGGARSGKSRYALQLAERAWPRPVFLATAEVTDAEMAARIAAHRAARGAAWQCVEEPLDLAGALARAAGQGDGVLLDCLTVWLSNVLVKEGAATVTCGCGSARPSSTTPISSPACGWRTSPRFSELLAKRRDLF